MCQRMGWNQITSSNDNAVGIILQYKQFMQTLFLASQYFAGMLHMELC